MLAVSGNFVGASTSGCASVVGASTLKCDPPSLLVLAFSRLLREIVPRGGSHVVACAGRASRAGWGLARAGIAQ